MSYYSEECVDQGHALTSEVEVDEDPMPISFNMVKHEPVERNPVYKHVTGIKEEYEDHSQDLTSEVKVQKDPETISFPVVKREPEEQNILDQHVTGIKYEYVNQNPDLISEIKFEEDPVPISFPVVKREPEETQSDLHTMNEEPRMELTAEDNDSLIESIFCSGLQLPTRALYQQYWTVLHLKRMTVCVRFPRIQVPCANLCGLVKMRNN
ncbi:uncharacterized protein [Periplaneta americana]|uniref:uncharacterized protein isoform X2 n=1 Tax=Periplaneta americana TaxID=6978 RepID=UPI0037E8EAFF